MGQGNGNNVKWAFSQLQEIYRASLGINPVDGCVYICPER